MIAKTTINGLNVAIEPNEDRPGVNCYITTGDGHYTASLACAEGEGELWYCGPGSPRDGDEATRPIGGHTLALIRTFAEEHGY